jgi:hypothetical protein
MSAELPPYPVGYVLVFWPLVAVLQPEKRTHYLAIVGVLEPDHNRHGDGRVRDQPFFNLQWVNVFTS